MKIIAEEIRGLNVKFDADFSSFKKSMKEADKDINSTQKQLKSLQDSLKLEWDPKKFEKAQAEARKAIDATEQKASILKARLAEMEKAGVTDKTRDEYNYLLELLEKTELNALKLRQQLEQLDELQMKNLTKGLDEASDKLDKAAQKTKALSTAAAAGVTALTALGLSTIKQADDIATLATQYNTTTDAIQKFNYVALQTDTDAEYLYKGLVKIQAGVADMSTGISTVATKALQQLGLSFDQFSGTEEQFYAIINALATMEDQTKMVSLANDIFGEKMAVGLLPLIYAGSNAINEYRQEFDQLGALTENQITELANFDNVLNKLKTQYKNVGLQLGSSFLPVLQQFSDILTQDILPVLKNVVERFNQLDRNQQSSIVSGLLLIAVLSPMLSIFSKLTGAISLVVSWLGKLDKATLATYGKWILLTAAVSSLFSVIANWSKMNAVQKVIGLLGSLSAAALAAALAFGAFHSAWSIGLAVAGIVAGIAAATAAVKAAGEEIGVDANIDSYSSASSYSLPEYSVPQTTASSTGTVNNSSSTYVDNSNIVVNIEKNDYMSEDDIIRAVNKGLKQAKQART